MPNYCFRSFSIKILEIQKIHSSQSLKILLWRQQSITVQLQFFRSIIQFFAFFIDLQKQKRVCPEKKTRQKLFFL